MLTRSVCKFASYLESSKFGFVQDVSVLNWLCHNFCRFRDIKRQMRRSKYGNIGIGRPKNEDEGGNMADVPHWEVFLKIGLHHVQKKRYEKALANFSQAKDLERSGTEPR